MKFKYIKSFWLLGVAGLVLAGCADTLVDDMTAPAATGDGLQFSLSTVEMGRQAVALGGGTRGAGGPTGLVAAVGEQAGTDRFTERLLQGDNPYGLKLQRMPLPLVGIHRGAVGGPAVSPQASARPTRAGGNEPVATDMTNFHDSLTIWGYTNQNTVLFKQILLTKVRNWRSSVEWPYGKGDYMRFFAVAPSLESVNIKAATDINYNKPPELTYTLPETAAEMRDLLYGESEILSIADGPDVSATGLPQQDNLGKDNKLIGMQFRHILTAVRFAQGTVPEGLTITGISLQGARSEGTFKPNEQDDNTHSLGKWFPTTAVRNYTVAANHKGTGVAPADENVYLEGVPVLFMLPQELPSGAHIEVTLIDTKKGNKSHTLRCDINGEIWKKGYTVTYKITIGQLKEGYYLSTEASPELEHSSTPVSGTVSIDSYQLFNDYSSGTAVPTYRPVGWVIDGYSDDGGNTWKGTRPTWLTDFHGMLADHATYYQGGQNATISYTVARQEMTRSASHDVVLSSNSNSDIGGARVDLSTHYPYVGGPSYYDDGSMNPANCYIVNHVGGYEFPLVYGNMTKDEDQAACFKDHQGNTIKKYKIKEQIGAKDPQSEIGADELSTSIPYLWIQETTGYSAKHLPRTVRAKLLWQDVNGLVTGVNVASGKITFTIGQSVPGNAVIALQARKVSFDGQFGEINSAEKVHYDDSESAWETLWTWHIWMTDEVYRNEGTDDVYYYDTYYVNGPGEGKGDHIAQLQNKDGNWTKILPVNLGWVPDDDNFGLFSKRSVKVRLKQDGLESSETPADPIELTITQHARQQLYTGTGTVYQWGRPTAFPALRTVGGIVRSIYDIDGNDITAQFVLAQTNNAADAIAQPFHVLQRTDNANSWFDVGSEDYSNDNAMWSSDKKTVYDPCPPGYRVPPVSTFTGLSKTGETVVAEAGKLNMWPNVDGQSNGERSKGGYFYCKAHEEGDIPADERYSPMVYMPATGEWHGNKTVGTQLQEASEQLNQTNGLFWTSDYDKSGDSQACFLWLTPDYTFSAGTKEKPVIGLFDTNNKKNYYGSVRGIRPMAE